MLLGADFYDDHLSEIPLGVGRDAVLDRVIVDKNARIGDGARLTNERGVDDRVRYLRNVMGLWLLQETKCDGFRLDAAKYLVEEGTVRVVRPGEAPTDSTYIAVHAKKNGQWNLESVRETSLPEPDPHEQLKQLEWFVGEWVDESPTEVVEHRCWWSEDGHYLLGKFVVQWEGLPTMKGDLRIGWDPLTRQIKSWIFDTEGGYAEGLWTRTGDRWVVKLNGVRPDGSTASATNLYVPVRRDQIQFSSVDRMVGGQQEPDQTALIVRKPPRPKKS